MTFIQISLSLSLSVSLISSLSPFFFLSLSLSLSLSPSLCMSLSVSLYVFLSHFFSLSGEMCAVLYCGFPSLGDTMAAYPALLPHDQKAFIKGVKVVDFHKHLRYVLRARTFLVIIIVVVYGKDFFFMKTFFLSLYVRYTTFEFLLNNSISAYLPQFLLYFLALRCIVWYSIVMYCIVSYSIVM